MRWFQSSSTANKQWLVRALLPRINWPHFLGDVYGLCDQTYPHQSRRRLSGGGRRCTWPVTVGRRKSWGCGLSKPAARMRGVWATERGNRPLPNIGQKLFHSLNSHTLWLFTTEHGHIPVISYHWGVVAGVVSASEIWYHQERTPASLQSRAQRHPLGCVE